MNSLNQKKQGDLNNMEVRINSYQDRLTDEKYQHKKLKSKMNLIISEETSKNM